VPASFREGQHLFLVSNGFCERSFGQIVEFGSSEYASKVLNQIWGTAPSLSLETEAALQKLLIALADDGLISAAKDISDGGLGVALAESCFEHNVGVNFRLNCRDKEHPYMLLFGEFSSSVLLACEPGEKSGEVKRRIEAADFKIGGWGAVRGESLVIDDYDNVWDFGKIANLRSSWSASLESAIHEEVRA
jgi:phosphoribosylformylglycinamidine synthase subunit PurL